MITYRWGGVGWDNNVHVPVHTPEDGMLRRRRRSRRRRMMMMRRRRRLSMMMC